MEETYPTTLDGLMTGIEVATQLRDEFWHPLKNTISLSNDMATIHRALIDAITTLRAEKDDYEELLLLERESKRPSNSYKYWLQRVTTIESEVQVMTDAYETESQRSKVLKVLARSNFSKDMISKSLEVEKLLAEGKQLGSSILVDKGPERVINIPAPDITDFSTLQGPMQKVLNFLRTNKLCVGIKGTVGIGKTTILMNLNNHKEVRDLFDIVIWVTVSVEKCENLSLKEVQQAIATRLKLKIDDVINSDRIDEAAHIIREELKGKKYLLLLDNVTNDLNLARIGIDLKNENSSKIVFTSRLGHACHSVVDDIIKVTSLTPREAWKMFQNVLGQSVVRDNPNIEAFMPRVVKFCEGLPFVIKVVGSAFRMRDTEERWRDGFDNLRDWPKKGDDMLRELHKLLTFCCENLNDVQKNCFLYSAIYPEDNDIHKDCLLDCWAALNLYKENDNDGHEVLDHLENDKDGREVLHHLEKVSLLEEGHSKEHVRMHKLIRQAALYSLSVDNKHKHMVKTGKSLDEPLNGKDMGEKNWISLVGSKLKTLPDAPECFDLSTLLLHKNSNLNAIPDLFFKNMKNLLVLDLYGSGIVSLPSSVSYLKALKVLYVNCCANLTELPPQIAEMENLEVVDTRGSGVKNLPSDFEKLRNMRRLLVSFNNFSSEDDRQYVLQRCKEISKILSLEALIVDVKSNKESCSELIKVIRDTVGASLTKLITLKFRFENGVEDVINVVGDTLKFHFPEADGLTSFVERVNSNPESITFHIFIGCPVSTFPRIPNYYRYQKYLKYENGEVFMPVICEVLAVVDAFELINHSGLYHISEFGDTSFVRVKCCLIEDCNKIRTIIDCNSSMEISLLTNLKRLYMKRLPELISIWEGAFNPRSLCKLKRLEIEECDKIMELFAVRENDQVNQQILPSLKELVLFHVPKLRKICPNLSMKWPALAKLKVHNCPDLKELPFNRENAPKLKSIEGERSWWEDVQCQNEDVKNYFQLYCSLS